MKDFKMYGKYAKKVEKIIKRMKEANPFQGFRFNSHSVTGISQQNDEEPQIVVSTLKYPFVRFVPVSNVNTGNCNF